MIGEIITKVRKAKHISCAELGRRSGHSPSTITNIEYGLNTNPSFKTVCTIAEVLSIDLNILKNECLHIADEHAPDTQKQ